MVLGVGIRRFVFILLLCIVTTLVAINFVFFGAKASNSVTKTITITKKWLRDTQDMRPADITVAVR